MRRASIAALATEFFRAALLVGTILVPMPAGRAAATDPDVAAPANAAPDDDTASQRRAVRQGTFLIAERETGPWRWLARGDDCPASFALRVPETAPSALNWRGATLTADAGTRLTLKDDRTLVLNEGRIFLDATPGDVPRVVQAADVSIEVPAGAALEIALTGDATVRAITTRAGGEPSSIKAAAPSLTAAVDVAPGFAFSYGPRKESRTYLPLDNAQQEIERIAAWTAAAQPPLGLGQLVVNDPQSGQAERLNVARSHVNVVLAPPVVLVQLDQSFYNPYSDTREGTFVFNLPRGASVSRFAMYVNPTNLIEGELIARKRAATIYDRIVSGQRDPAILEQLGDNLFRMRVFPILANDVKRILLDFTLPIEALDGRCRFELPLLSDVEPIWDFRITGTVRGVARAEKVQCRTLPEMTFASLPDNSVRLEFARQNFRPSAPLDIEFPLGESREPTLRSYAAEALPQRGLRRDSSDPFDDGDAVNLWYDPWAGRRATYFLATLPSLDPQRPAEEPAPTAPADVLILADTSVGTHPQQAVRQAVRTLVRTLRPQDRFRLACADVALRPLDEDWLAPETAAAKEVLARFEQQVFLGASDLPEVLRTAAGLVEQVPPAPNHADDPGNEHPTVRRRFVVYVGDGVDFWNKGDDATVTWKGTELSCKTP